MNRIPLTTCIALTALALSLIANGTKASAAPKSNHVYGPPPDWARYKELIEPALRAKLPPGDWSIEWPNGYMKGYWRHRRGAYGDGTGNGYLTCGILRTDAPPRGFHPATRFVAVIDYNQVQAIDISTHESNSLVNVMCEFMVSRGYLPPAKMMDGPRDLPVVGLGLTIRPMPEGAYVVAVTPGSPSAKAGLTTGAVLTRANAITLAGMGAAMAAVLGSDTPALSIDTAAGGHVELSRAR